MSQPVLRIFSYQPNPRIYKATIAARLCGLEVELRGGKPRELANWLWDFDAQPLDDAGRKQYAASARQARTGFSSTLYKTDAFLAAHPYGTVPAAFSADGSIGVFESNSIMRAVVRCAENCGGLYGDTPIGAARIDGFLDVSLIFARESQVYLLSLMNDAVSADLHGKAADALNHWLGGIDNALGNGPYIAGDSMSLADICFACEVVEARIEQTSVEKIEHAGLEPMMSDALKQRFPRALAHFDKLLNQAAFAADLVPFLDKLKKRQSGF